jgi:hypothetical protein
MTTVANRLGDIRAERDTRMLDVAFYETPDFRALIASAERPIVVGRRGTGKSALCYELCKYWQRDKGTSVLSFVPEEDQVIGARPLLQMFGQRYSQVKAGAKIAWKYALILEIALALRDHWKFQSTLGYPILEQHAVRWRKLGSSVCSRFRALLSQELEGEVQPEAAIGGLANRLQLTELQNAIFGALGSQSSHRKLMKTLENKGFVPIRNAMGWNVPVKPPSDSQIVNEINGFEHVSYGMTVHWVRSIGMSWSLLISLTKDTSPMMSAAAWLEGLFTQRST